MPFGATASVVAWHRVGDLLLEIARRLLHLPAFRYVDDYFAAERTGIAQHGLGTFVRLVRAVLGSSAVADAKTEFRPELVILGIQVTSGYEGACFQLCPAKAEKWSAQIRVAIESLHLDSGSAQKLAGRLNFATQHLFHKLGRAMIKPIYAQKTTGTGNVGPRLLEALEWWLMVLLQNVTERRAWNGSDRRPCRLFVDAASTPARLAAVLFIDGQVFYSDAAPTQQLMEQLAARRDKQITSLEIIGILMALATFAGSLQGRKVILYSDNKGAEHTTARGSARAFDHNQLVHEIWTLVFQLGIHLWIERVPSKFNISDSPSRFEYQIMHDIGAQWCQPVLDPVRILPPE